MTNSHEQTGDKKYAILAAGLTKCFGGLTAVDNLNLQIGFGEIFGLLGPNGAGKSTTIKMLTTLLEPGSGIAQVAGMDIVKEAAGVRTQIGYVPQMLSADGALTGYENMMLSAKLYGMEAADRKNRIAETLQFMGISEFAHKLVKTYSGGMIRRLELAQAMIHRPQVLFLDEPTIGLDPVARRTVWDRLLNLKNQNNLTILMTTHDMEEADQLCDEIAILFQGKMSAAGTPLALKSAVGANAGMEEVFIHFSGGIITEGGNYRDVRDRRRTASRLG